MALNLYDRWVAAYKDRMPHPQDEKQIHEMARAAALRGDEPPPPRPFPITPETLRKQAEDTFQPSWLDLIKLALAWGVIKRKVVAPMGSWRTTVFGAIAAALNYALVMLQNGTPIPQNSHDWVMLGLSCALAGFAFATKDASVGSQPGDPPTKERIAGAALHGETVKVDDVEKTLLAAKVVGEIAASAQLKPAPPNP